ncbi:taurine catabolism dioxygenase [Chrysochromulina tobinii]|uniref:Taurine catabolism dioxygenase n=1 Tax=Chrysochromulina tobinii TaxID=1460289 RepID=A0A0M0JA70_9EUKA|nr:taurine catabolism dioxygenase [Chrysochromulina tobinii]|eukprot:KOO23262.1 taurine catabolism dioxygenase [Chrysochromulina sp. CCMP291]
MFFCEQSAPSGGATPIIESHLAAAYLRSRHPDVAARLEQKGVRYVRIMPPVTDTSSALGDREHAGSPP